MDSLQEYAPHLFTLYNTMSPHLRSLNGVLATLNDLASTYVSPALAPILTTAKAQLAASSGNPDIASIALLLALFVVSLAVMRMLWRAVLNAIWFAVRATFVLSLVVMGLLVYVRGWGLVDDVADWGSEIGRVYQGEKGRWESVARQGGPAFGGSDSRRGARVGTWR